MTEELSVEEAVEVFERIESATAIESNTEYCDVAVFLGDSSDIGQFYETVDELNVNLSNTDECDLTPYDFHSWVSL